MRKQIIGLVAVVLAGAAFNAVAAQYADGENVTKGVAMTLKGAAEALEKLGVVEIEALAERIDLFSDLGGVDPTEALDNVETRLSSLAKLIYPMPLAL